MRSLKVFTRFFIILLITTQGAILAQSWHTSSVTAELVSSDNEIDLNSINSISLTQSGFSLPKVSESTVVIDGVISPSEYVVSYLDTKTNMLIYWEHNGVNLTIGTVAPETGWVAWGVGSAMLNSNIILGGFSSGSQYCIDMIGTGQLAPENDTDNAGSDNILECASSEDAGSTTLEFIFPLDSGDPLDPIIVEDSITDMFFAFSPSDDISSNHGFPGHTDILSVQIESVEYQPKPEIDDFDESIPFVKDSLVIIDGVIGVSEYRRSIKDEKTGIEVFWEHNEVNLTVGLVSPGIGWVALGIGESMSQSSMYMGGFQDGSTYCIDLDGIGQVIPAIDSDSGGLDDIIVCEATETETTTTLEFIVPLISGDPLDVNLDIISVNKMFFAYQISSDDIIQIHTAYSDKYRILVMPEADSFDTILDFESESEAEFNQTLFFEITLTNENEEKLSNMPVIFYRKTQFGLVVFESTLTDAEGKANASYFNPYLLNDHTFGAKSKEFVDVNETGDLYTYLSSEDEQVIKFIEKIEHDDRAEQIRLSRIGLLVAFWIVGIVIWGGFGYTFYQMYQIFKGRNDELEESITDNRNKTEQGGNTE